MRNTSFDIEDILSLSKGKPSKNKVGSRSTPHRLNKFERAEFEIAIKKGFLKYNSKTRLAIQNTFEEFQRARNLPAIKIFENKEIQIVSENPEHIATIINNIPESIQLNPKYVTITTPNPKATLEIIFKLIPL